MQIPLSSKVRTGYVAIIDDDDYELVQGYRWRVLKASRRFYAICSLYQKGKKSALLMHRLIAGANKGQVVDHKNNDTMDNRRVNLRICTSSQNAMNSKVRKHNKTGVRNVKIEVRNGIQNLRAVVTANGVVHRKCFGSPNEININRASAWADELRHRLHGDFAYSKQEDAR